MKCRPQLFPFSLCSCPSGSPCGELLPVLFQSLNSTGLSQKLCHVSDINKYLFLKLMGSVLFLCALPGNSEVRPDGRSPCNICSGTVPLSRYQWMWLCLANATCGQEKKWMLKSDIGLSSPLPSPQ